MTAETTVRVPRWLVIIVATAVATQLGGSLLTLWQLVPRVQSLENRLSESVETLAGEMTRLGNTVKADRADIYGRLAKLENTVEIRRAADRQFHIDQRIRLWDRVKENQLAQTAAENRLARVESSTEHIKGQVDRLVTRLIDDARP